MTSTTWTAPRGLMVAITIGVAAALAGCSGTPDPQPAVPTGVPASWLERTTEGWPDSDGHDSSIPVLGDGPCLLADSPPEFFGASTEYTDVGWGPAAGSGDSDDPSFRYLCHFWAEDTYAGELQLIKADDAELDATVQEFVDQPSTSQQENTVEQVRSGRLDVQVLRRWYPTNPQGLLQAMVLDREAGAVATLEINSLDRDRFDQTSSQQVADALVGTFIG